nr:radical SAM protein [Candidatus Sigynarchaeota archaeon]
FALFTASSHPYLGLAMIAACLKKANHDVHVIDATVERLNIHRLTKRLEAINPDIIGITANVSFWMKALLTGRWLKKKFPTKPILFGGPWPTSEPEKVLTSGAGDYVVMGEGEITTVELISMLATKSPVHDVHGIAFLENGMVIKTPPRARIENLDDLPFPAWELFPESKRYFFNSMGKHYYPILTSRGCPLGCIHCTKAVHGYKFRMRSVESIINEIKYLHDKFHMDEIIIVDDNFNYDIEHAEKICDAIIKLDFKIAMRFSNGIRADKITARLAWKLKQAGAYDIALGIESGNQEIVYKIGKHLNLANVERAAWLLKRLQINTSGFFMIGLPNETIKSILDTKRFIMKLDLDTTHLFRALPFPGTRMFTIIKQRGHFLDNYEKGLYFYSLNEPLFEFDHLPKELIEFAIQDISKAFYRRPAKILSFLRKLRIREWRWYLNASIITFSNIYGKKGQKNNVRMKKVIIDKLIGNRFGEGSRGIKKEFD